MMFELSSAITGPSARNTFVVPAPPVARDRSVTDASPVTENNKRSRQSLLQPPSSARPPEMMSGGSSGVIAPALKNSLGGTVFGSTSVTFAPDAPGGGGNSGLSAASMVTVPEI